jgi:hypothetical protein
MADPHTYNIHIQTHPMSVNSNSNLKCPGCGEQFSSLTVAKRSDELELSSKSLQCTSCWESCYPENALLNYIESSKSDGLFGISTSLGGHGALGLTHIEIGETQEHDSISLVEGASIDSVHLTAARKAEDQDLDFKINHLGSSFTRFSIDDAVLINVTVSGDGSDLIFSSSLRDDSHDEFDMGDRIDLKYRYVIAIPDIQNPPWVDLLREAESAIRKNETISALPLTISAFQNLLYRQVSLSFRERGFEDYHIRRVLQFHSDSQRLRWRNIAKEGLEDVGSKRLTHSDYRKEWQTYDNLRQHRDDIIHPDIMDDVQKPTRQEAIDYFTGTLELMLDVYNICESGR